MTARQKGEGGHLTSGRFHGVYPEAGGGASGTSQVGCFTWSDRRRTSRLSLNVSGSK
jgi:hypothetical protein